MKLDWTNKPTECYNMNRMVFSDSDVVYVYLGKLLDARELPA